MNKPIGLGHQDRDFCVVRMKHFIILLHQREYPELSEKMRLSGNSSAIYSAFLAMLPLQLKNKLTPEIRREILKAYKLL